MALAAALAVVLVATVWAWWGRPQVDPAARSSLPVPGPSPTPAPEEPRFELTMKVGRVNGFTPRGNLRKRQLRRHTRIVERATTDLYSAAFVDPEEWRGGRFPRVPGFFAAETRRQARKDLQDLTLGRAARHLDAVRPRRARLHLRFLMDRGRRPVSAVASVAFSGTGLAEGVRVPIEHRGRYVLRRAKAGWRVAAYEVEGRVPSPREIQRQRARFQPGVPSRRPLFILAIGSDARPGQRVAGARADAIQIIAINPRRRAASVVGIPRDSYVPIPGVGTRKINEALFHGGPDLMVRTVQNLTGIRFRGYLLTGFQDFQRMVSRVGGVEVNVPYRMSDRYSGAYFQPGKRRLRGPAALAFTRNRYDAPGGDFGRSFNQGRLILAALREFRRDFRENPISLLRWVAAGTGSIQTDLTVAELVGLLLAAPTIEPDRVRNDVVAGRGGMVGAQSVVLLGSEAQAVFRDIRRNGMLGG